MISTKLTQPYDLLIKTMLSWTKCLVFFMIGQKKHTLYLKRFSWQITPTDIL